MARKKKRKVNSKLITILLVLAIPALFIIIVAVDSKKPILPRFVHEILGRDPVVLLEQAEKQLGELEDNYNQLKAENRAIKDPKEAAEKWAQVFEDVYAPHARKVYDLILDGKRFSKGDTELQIQSQMLMSRFHLITGTYIGGALGAWDSIIKLDVNNYEAWENKAEFYTEVIENYYGSESIEKLRESAENLQEIKPEDPKGYTMALIADIYNLRYNFSSNVLTDESAAVTKLTELKEKYPNDIQIAKCAALLYGYQVSQTDSYERKRSLMDKVAQELKPAIEANPGNVEAVINYCKYFLNATKSMIYSELVKADNEVMKDRLSKELSEFNDSANGEFGSYLLKYPKNAELKVLQADYLLALPGANYQIPLELYKQAVELEPENLFWLTVVGKLTYISGLAEDSGDDYLIEARSYLQRAYYGFNDSLMTGVMGARTSSARYAETMPYLALVDTELAGSIDDAKAELQEIAILYKEDKGKDVAITKSVEGLLDIAGGNKQEAMQKLYSTVSSDEFNSFSIIYAAELRWKLFELLKDTQYKVIALNNAALAFRAHMRSASDFVELVDTYLSLPSLRGKQEVVKVIELYIDKFSDDKEQMKDIRLRYVRALLATGERDKAGEILNGIKGEGLTYDILKCQVIADDQERLDAIEVLAKRYPGDPDVVNYLNSIYYSRLKDDKSFLAKAKALMARAVMADPDNINFIQSQKRLEEPDPSNIPYTRQLELQLQVIEGMKDKYEQAMMYGRYYNTLAAMKNESNDEESMQVDNVKAVEYFEKASELKPDSVEPLKSMLMTYMLIEEFDKAEDVIKRIESVDSFTAKFARIDLLVARGKNDEALELLTGYLEKYPLSARGHLVLAKVYSNLGRQAEAKSELTLSIEQDRFDANAITEYLKVLHEGNIAIGLDKIGQTKIQETLSWAEHLLSLEPSNIVGARFFIQYAPLWAMLQDQQLKSTSIDENVKQQYLNNIAAIENRVINNINLLISSIRNNESVYVLSLRALQELQRVEALAQRREMYLKMMSQVYETALSELPGSSVIMSNYEMFLRATGQSGKGMDMLKEQINTASGEERVEAVVTLARLYYLDGDKDKAVNLLTEEISKCEDLDLKFSMRNILASIFKESGDFDSALEVYSQQRREKDSDDLMTLQIETMMDGGYPERAEPLLKEMENKYPDDYKVYLLRAKSALRQTDYEMAVEYADKALAVSPNNTIALRIKSQSLFLGDRYPEAKEVIELLRRVSSDNINEGRAILAQIFWRNNQFDEAILELRKGLEVEPGNSQLNLLFIDMLKSRRKWNELIGYYENRIKMYPDNISLYSECASTIDEWATELIAAGNSGAANEKLNDALNLLNKAMQIATENSQPLAALIDSKASVMLRKGMYDEVVKNLTDNSEMVEAMPAMALKLVQALYETGQKEAAFDNLAQMLAKISDSVMSEYILERVVRIIPPDEIISWVDSNIDNYDEKGLLYLIKAMAYRVKGDTNQFFVEAKHALSESAGSPSSEILAKSKLAIAYIQTKEYDKSIELYRDLVNKLPNSYLLLNNLAYALLSAGSNDEEALDVATRAYNMARLEPMVLDTYGMALRQNKQFDQAYQIFKKAIQEARRRNQVVQLEFEFHMAQVMKDLDLIDDARENLEDLLKRAKLSKSPSDQMLVGDIEALLNEIK